MRFILTCAPIFHSKNIQHESSSSYKKQERERERKKMRKGENKNDGKVGAKKQKRIK